MFGERYASQTVWRSIDASVQPGHATPAPAYDMMGVDCYINKVGLRAAARDSENQRQPQPRAGRQGCPECRAEWSRNRHETCLEQSGRLGEWQWHVYE